MPMPKHSASTARVWPMTPVRSSRSAGVSNANCMGSQRWHSAANSNGRTSPIMSCFHCVRGLPDDAMAAPILFVWTNGEDGAGGRAHHTLRNTSHDQMAKARATCRCHHDQIDLLSLGHVDNFLVG